MDNLISQALTLCGFSSSINSIDALKSWALAHMVDNKEELVHLDLNDWLTTIGIASPEVLLPDYMYFVSEISDDVITKVCDRLKAKKLTATKREIHELAWWAVEINENLDKITDIKHAINYVLVMFKSGGWETPSGFEEALKFYATKAPEFIPLQKNQSHCENNKVIH